MSCVHNRHDEQVYTVDDATYVPSGAVAMTTHYLPFAILTTILKLTAKKLPPLPLNSYSCNKQHHLEWWSIKLLNLIKMATDASGQQQPLLGKGVAVYVGTSFQLLAILPTFPSATLAFFRAYGLLCTEEGQCI